MSTTSLTGAVHGELWPTKAQMYQNLDSWEAHVRSLRDEIQLLKQTSATREKVLSDHVSSLRLELAATERPLLEKISGLEVHVLELQSENRGLRAELDQAVTLLAAGLEETGTRHSLLILVNNAILLIDESKKQLRETL